MYSARPLYFFASCGHWTRKRSAVRTNILPLRGWRLRQVPPCGRCDRCVTEKTIYSAVEVSRLRSTKNLASTYAHDMVR